MRIGPVLQRGKARKIDNVREFEIMIIIKRGEAREGVEAEVKKKQKKNMILEWRERERDRQTERQIDRQTET